VILPPLVFPGLQYTVFEQTLADCLPCLERAWGDINSQIMYYGYAQGTLTEGEGSVQFTSFY
jgi:hypothetical protein